MFNKRLIAVLLLSVLACQPVLSQTLPSCRSLASDADGDGYGWENDNSCIVTSTSLASPTFTNLETGNPVDLIRASWNPSDFVNTTDGVFCRRYEFDGARYRSIRTGYIPLYVFQPLSQMPPHHGNVVVTEGPTQTWTLENGIYFGPSDLAISPWVEIVYRQTPQGDRVRIWLTDETFSLCGTPNPYARLAPTGSPIQNNADTVSQTSSDSNNCDYSNATIYDGWGWDPVAGTSCEPIDASPTDNCDYSNAGVFDGWGWDATTGQSCEPILPTNDVTLDQDCDYTNGPANEGWGWNPVTRTSCSPL